MNARGFTLIEMLTALAVLALVAATAYGALAPAGEGFRMLAERHRTVRLEAWLAERLREDVRWLAWDAGGSEPPVRLQPDRRGGASFDQCWLRTRLPGRAGVWIVHYRIDEEKGRLVREARMALARPEVEPVRAVLGQAVSLRIEALDASGRWRSEWGGADARGLPRMLRVRLSGADGEREWLLPVLTGRSW